MQAFRRPVGAIQRVPCIEVATLAITCLIPQFPHHRAQRSIINCHHSLHEKTQVNWTLFYAPICACGNRSAKKKKITRTHLKNIFSASDSLGLTFTKMFFNRAHFESNSPKHYSPGIPHTDSLLNLSLSEFERVNSRVRLSSYICSARIQNVKKKNKRSDELFPLMSYLQLDNVLLHINTMYHHKSRKNTN